MLRIGVAGLGFGRHLMDTLLTRDDCVVAGVADHFAKRLETPRAKGLPIWRDAATMIREAGLDAVVIASAPHTRAPALDAAMDLRLPVFMEKPVAGTLEQARALAARIGDHPVMIGYSFRFHAPVRRLLAELPDLGAPRVLNAAYLFDWLPPSENWLWDPQKGGGFFTENSGHLFDVVAAVMGPPGSVHAVAHDDGGRPSATAAALTLRYASGAVAALTVGGIGTGAMDDFPCLDVACTGGQARLRGRQHMWTGLEWARRGGAVQTMAHDPETLGRTRYSEAFDAFLNAVRDGAPMPATAADGVAAVALADAVYRSIETNRPEEIKA